MSATAGNKKLIAVVGATGQQGGAVVGALQAGAQFRVRALSRNPAEHRDLADEVVEANLDRPETLTAAFQGVHGVFLVTNFWNEGTDERKQATAAIDAAKNAGVKHFVWSTLPNVEAISGGKFNVPHFTGKAKIDLILNAAGFAYHTFVHSRGSRRRRARQIVPSSTCSQGSARRRTPRRRKSRSRGCSRRTVDRADSWHGTAGPAGGEPRSAQRHVDAGRFARDRERVLTHHRARGSPLPGTHGIHRR
jgi:NmrA-like family protein